VLAIALGAATSVFSVVDGVLLKPLPLPDADRLIAIQSVPRRICPRAGRRAWIHWSHSERIEQC
jgi:hypothetical protein